MKYNLMGKLGATKNAVFLVWIEKPVGVENYKTKLDKNWIKLFSETRNDYSCEQLAFDCGSIGNIMCF